MSVIETCFRKVTGVFGDYSEKQLMDCAYGQDGAGGCKGAWSVSYVRWANTTEGRALSFLSEADYPYGKNGKPIRTCPTSLRKTELEEVTY